MDDGQQHRVDEAIFDATRQLLTETGYARVSVGAVARRAKVGRAVVHRRFGGRAALVLDAVAGSLDAAVPPDCGSLREDLVALVGGIVDTLSAPMVRHAVAGLIGDAAADAQLADRFRLVFVTGQRAAVLAVLDRAVGRGELEARPDPQVIHTLLLGPVLAALLLIRMDPADLAVRIATVVTAAYTPLGDPNANRPGRVATGMS